MAGFAPEVLALFQKIATGRLPDAGRVFFVSGTGLNTNPGTSPDKPFATITHALIQCLAGRGDTIFVLSTTAEPLYPVSIAKSDVHIIGVTNPGVDPKIHVFGGGNQCFNITTDGDRLEVAGIGFGTNGEDALYGIQVYGAWIHHCAFGGSPLYNAGLLRTAIIGDQWPASVFEDNFFGGGYPLWGELTGYAITMAGLVNNVVRRNHFLNCALGAIRSDGANMELAWILDNRIYAGIAEVPPIGWAINLNGGGVNYGGMIDGNHATETGDDTAANVPYRDMCGGALALIRGWGLNYLNDTPSDPAFA